MAEEDAGIWLSKGAEKAFYGLAEAGQRRLAAFLHARLGELDATGGGSLEGCAAEWQPGWGVFWDVALKPKYRGLGQAAKSTSSRLGSSYRIEVLEIKELA